VLNAFTNGVRILPATVAFVRARANHTWGTWSPELMRDGSVPLQLGHPGVFSESFNFRIKGLAHRALEDLMAEGEDAATVCGLTFKKPVNGLHVSWNN